MENQGRINFSKTPNTGMIMDAIGNTPDNYEEKQKNIKNAIENKQIQEYMKMFKKPKQVVREHNINRNDPCPCGSGKKYKNCCLNTGKYENTVEVNKK